ncbi:MAG: hypothetical protein WBQ08_20845 [Candidatus Sulfotelmatobacter sp.]
MKSIKRLFLTFLTLAALSAGAWAQTSDSTAPQPKKKHKPAAAEPAQPVTAADVQELKDALAAQQQQIRELREELHRKDQAVQQAQTAAADASGKADAAQAQAAQQQQAVTQAVIEVKSEVADLKAANNTASSKATLKDAVWTVQESPQTSSPDAPQTFDKQMEGPLTIHFRGINITPGGYAAAEFVRRSRALGADVSTPFNSLTMPGASQSQIPEFFGSARQSKITSFVDGRMKNMDLSSYVSADFLSAGVTSTSTETNSYTLRLRQAWGQVRFENGWSFLGGQSWSLVTENGRGISPDDDLGRTNDARPKTIDPSYNVGFIFARQYGLRVTKSFGDKVAFAVAIENPQATLTTHNNVSNFLLGEAGASNSYNTTANYSFNPAPDLIAKVAFDPGFGHYEIFGLADRFTDRVFPCVENYASATCGSLTAPSALLAYNASREGGGIGASARWNIARHVVFGLKGFGGNGIGRYAPGGLADASINADGTIHLIKNLQGLSTLELHLKKFDIYGYGGVEYAARTYDYDSTVLAGATTPVGDVGYGAPGFSNAGCLTETPPGSGGFSPGSLSHCTADTRALIEGTAGFWYRFYSGPRGKFQFGTQYSYVTRNTWSGVGGEPNGIDNMVFTSFRYYLP